MINEGIKDIVIVGAGPAGLAAALAVSRSKCSCVLIDDNPRVGGQLLKQTHKFFGSQDHRAGQRGIHIAEELAEKLNETTVEVWLESTVIEIKRNQVWVSSQIGLRKIEAKKIILATGANENSIAFPGWTLPGIMGAGALQTMMNLHKVLPGKNVLMVGAGNVGLIVSYQLLQAGANVVSLIEAAQDIKGYEVHAFKLVRMGIPIFTSTTILSAFGKQEVEGAIIASVDDDFVPIPGTQREINVDTICLAVGLSPLSDLAWMAGCEMTYNSILGGWVPVHDNNQRTTSPDIYVAGDCSSIEEASVAMEEGRVAGLDAIENLGILDSICAEKEKRKSKLILNELRSWGTSNAIKKEKSRLRETSLKFKQDFSNPARYTSSGRRPGSQC